MEVLKKLLLIVLAPSFVLFISWVLSTYNDFAWWGIVFFAISVIAMQILLCIANPKKLIVPVPGYMIAGSLYAFIAADACGEYEPVFEFFAVTMFAFTVFFTWLPHVVRWLKER
jgi:hypothetical protein